MLSFYPLFCVGIVRKAQILVSKWILEAFLATFELGEALGVVFLTPQHLFCGFVLSQGCSMLSFYPLFCVGIVRKAQILVSKWILEAFLATFDF
jgi:hypothetical protein